LGAGTASTVKGPEMRAGAGVVDERLVVEGFFARRFVVGDGFEGDVRDFFVFEAAADAFVGMGEFVVVEGGGHQALFGKGGGDAGGVAGDPAAAPLFGDKGGGAGVYGLVFFEVETLHPIYIPV